MENYENISDETIWDALSQANAQKFVEKFDKKLDYYVGSGGGSISGG